MNANLETIVRMVEDVVKRETTITTIFDDYITNNVCVVCVCLLERCMGWAWTWTLSTTYLDVCPCPAVESISFTFKKIYEKKH